MLDEKVKQLDAAIDGKRQQAQASWLKVEEMKKDLGESDVDLADTESDAFKKFEETYAVYGKEADELSALEGRRAKLWQMTSTRQGPQAHQALVDSVKDGMGSVQSPGARAVATEAYQRLRESGALVSTSTLGNVLLGEVMSRDELLATLVGKAQGSVIVTTDGVGDSTVRPFIEPHRRGFIEPRLRPLVITDLITVLPIDTDTIEYVVETGFTNNAAFVAEASTDAPISETVTAAQAGLKPQSVLSYEKKTESIKTIAHWMAATKKSLADASRLQGLIDTRLRRGIADVVEDQVIAGDGTGENLTGILNTTGIQHQQRGAGPLVDDMLRAITKLILANFRPSAHGIDPVDWEAIRLMRDESGGAGTGQYLFGPPSAAGATTIWGVPTVVAPQFVQGQPITADWAVAELYVREGLSVSASDSHADFFVRNLVAVLAEMRLGLVLPEPEGFCEVSEGS